MKNRIATSCLRWSLEQLRSAILVSIFLSALCLCARAQAIIPCGSGGPPPGSIPRAIAKAPLFTIPPSLIPVQGTYLWVLYENRFLSLLLLPENWPASPAIQVNTMNLSVPSGFGIPANFELYDVATGPGNFSGYGFYYTTARVVGRDLSTGQHRTQIVGISAGGGCGNFLQPVISLNISPASVGAVQYPQDYLIYHLWSLEQTAPGLEPGTITPDQNITLRHLPTGGVAVLPPVDEDQILCAPGVTCPNWASTLMQQMTGDAVHMLLRDETTGAQSIGWLNLGNAGFGGFNGCTGSVNPCLYQRANLPAPISGNVIDIAGETFIPNRVWVMWGEEILAPAPATPDDVPGKGPSVSASIQPPPAMVYKLGAINGNGSLIGSMTISTTDGSGGGGGGGGGSGSLLHVAPTKIDFGSSTPPGGRGEGIYNIRNLGRNDLVITSMTFTNQTGSPFSFCDPVRFPFTLQPQQQREFRACFQPQTPGVFQSSIAIRGGLNNSTLAAIQLEGSAVSFQDKPDCCSGKKATKKLIYSRGNNDWDEMKAQHEATDKKTYQFQTARIELSLEADPAKCRCEPPNCKGEMEVLVEMKFLDVTRGRRVPDPTIYAMLDGIGLKGLGHTAPPGTGVVPGSSAPGPDQITVSEKVNYPDLRDENRIRSTGGNNYVARAKAKISCADGFTTRRFLLVPWRSAGSNNNIPGGDGNLAAYLDVDVRVKRTGNCELSVELKAYLLDYAPAYDPTNGGQLPGADKELPEVTFTVEGLDLGRTKTYNLIKLIEEDGKAYDKPFEKKSP